MDIVKVQAIQLPLPVVVGYSGPDCLQGSQSWAAVGFLKLFPQTVMELSSAENTTVSKTVFIDRDTACDVTFNRFQDDPSSEEQG